MRVLESIDLKKNKNEFFFSAPGRTELAGNHTDHNGGLALVMSINLKSEAYVKIRNDNMVYFKSENFPLYVVDLNNTDVIEEEKGTTASLIRGMAFSIKKRGGHVGGFEASVKSSVLPGSGLSSSASIEILIGRIFNRLFNNDEFSQVDLAIIGREAENVFFGKPCGLMDQLACSFDDIIKIDFKNSEQPVITPIKEKIKDFGYNIVIVDTKGSHANLTDDYKSIPEEMMEVASFFGQKVLGMVEPEIFFDSINEVRKSLNNDRAVLRAVHFFEENKRVIDMVNSLKSGNFSSYLSIVKDCGKSSSEYLQNLFSIKNYHSQGLGLGLSLTDIFLNGEGASRIHGGGFAGTIQTYVPLDKTDSYVEYMNTVFGDKSCYIV